MAKQQIQSPHDKIFRHLFSDPIQVEAFLRGVLPAELLEKLDLTTLEREPDSFVDDQLREHLADIVYQCQFEEEDGLELAFLFEHKSYPPKYPHFQLLRYMLNLWESRLKQDQPVQVVLPILVYHGKEAWQVKSMESYFGSGKIPHVLKPYFPNFDFQLVDLRSSAEETIRGQFHLPSLKLALLLMKYVFDPNLEDKLPLLILELFELLKEEEEAGNIKAIFVYLRNVVGEEVREKVMKQVEHHIEEYDRWGAVVGSTAWHEHQAGIAAGKELIAQNLLREGFSIEDTARLSDLSIERIEELKANL